ncbi:MAG: CPBP family intramembrane metalloprotease [Verrucomicrobia bacterium]|nr:CPBP family intramembrane metalloprotease [Verrucomicrobiota bacterium]
MSWRCPRIDLYLGLALVALVEEVIFRGLFFTLLSRHAGPHAALVSSLRAQ